MRTQRGYTLIELVLVLAFTGVLVTFAAPPLLHWRDAAAVHAARDDLTGALASVRVEAVAHGGGALVLDPVAGVGWAAYDDGTTEAPIDLRARHGVVLDVGAAAPVRIRYDGLGIGRMASRRIEVRRGRAVAGVTVSAYGRVRRW